MQGMTSLSQFFREWYTVAIDCKNYVADLTFVQATVQTGTRVFQDWHWKTAVVSIASVLTASALLNETRSTNTLALDLLDRVNKGKSKLSDGVVLDVHKKMDDQLALRGLTRIP